MSSHAGHDRLRDQVLLAVGGSGFARVWPNEVGLVRAFDNPDRVFFTGIHGAADILGILCTGTFLAIEIKTGKGKLRQSQLNFQVMVSKFNGVFIEGRSVDQVLTEVKAACKTLSTS